MISIESLKNNKVFWIVIAVTALNFGIFIVGKVLVDRVADRVINKLKKEYSPSNYGPGFDPDKINPNAFKTQQFYLDRDRHSNNKVFNEEKLNTKSGTRMDELIDYSDKWREEWEKSRGVLNQ